MAEIRTERGRIAWRGLDFNASVQLLKMVRFSPNFAPRCLADAMLRTGNGLGVGLGFLAFCPADP